MAGTPFDSESHTVLSARQEFMTPGARATLDMASDRCGLGPESLVLEVAAGKGEAACLLAERHGCRVLALDAHSGQLRYAGAKARLRRLRPLVAFGRADGRRLPVADGHFDLALCIGSPAIVGLPDCWREMRRAVRPGGWLVMSDAVVARRPPAAVRRRWPEWAERTLLFQEYRQGVEKEGLRVEVAELLPPPVWDEYYAPMLGLIEEVRRYRGGDLEAQAWADRNEAIIRVEQATLPYLAYAHFLVLRLE